MAVVNATVQEVDRTLHLLHSQVGFMMMYIGMSVMILTTALCFVMYNNNNHNIYNNRSNNNDNNNYYYCIIIL